MSKRDRIQSHTLCTCTAPCWFSKFSIVVTTARSRRSNRHWWHTNPVRNERPVILFDVNIWLRIWATRVSALSYAVYVVAPRMKDNAYYHRSRFLVYHIVQPRIRIRTLFYFTYFPRRQTEKFHNECILLQI